MVLKKLVVVLGVAMAAPAAWAASPIKLDCPSGTTQVVRADMVVCSRGRSAEGAMRSHGPMVLLAPDGSKESEGRAENGLRTGLWTFYDRAGNKTGTAHFKGGNFHGEVVTLHANGKPSKVEQFSEGIRSGTVKSFDANGKLLRVTQWEGGRRVASK
jgi:hypothetical protein